MCDGELGDCASLVSMYSGSWRIGQQASRYPVCMFPRRRSLGIRRRVARFVRALFGGSSSGGRWDDETEGGVGVREPRRPLTPSLTGAATLDLPDDDDPS
jgi:hypothetical protein